MIHFVVPLPDTVQDYFDGLLKPIESQCTTIAWRDLLNKSSLDPGVYIMAGLNRLGPGSLALLTEVLAAINGQPGFRVLNDPTQTLGRYELLTKLRAEGLNDFSIFGAWEDLSRIRFPAFVRDRSRDGGTLSLLHSMWQVDRAIGRALFDGAAIDQIIVVEFLDTADTRGVYRKYSAYKIGDRILPVSIDSGREWVMRAQSTQFTRESLEEEREFLSQNPHKETLARVFELAGVGFGRIDYSLKAGRLQTWEINTLPTIEDWSQDSPAPAALHDFQRGNEELGYLRIPEALTSTIPVLIDKDAIPLTITSGTAELAATELEKNTPAPFPAPVRMERSREMLRPFKRLFNSVLDLIALPLVSMVARFRARRTSHG